MHSSTGEDDYQAELHHPSEPQQEADGGTPQHQTPSWVVEPCNYGYHGDGWRFGSRNGWRSGAHSGLLKRAIGPGLALEAVWSRFHPLAS
jgi:hypothetical protein